MQQPAAQRRRARTGVRMCVLAAAAAAVHSVSSAFVQAPAGAADPSRRWAVAGLLSAALAPAAPALADGPPAWEGEYADPRHVGCKRAIKANRGPKDLPAKWDGDGIKFADGNKWKKLN